MGKYDYLKKYCFSDLDEADSSISADCPHYFISISQDEISENEAAIKKKLGISFPKELIDFWIEVGAGDFYSFSHNQHRGRYSIMDPMAILGVYFEEDDVDELYNTIRADAHDEMENNSLMAFCEFNEYSALYISLRPNDKGEHTIHYCGKKIANSLEEFVIKLLEKPDYFFS